MGNIPTKPPTLPPTPYPTMSPTPYPTVSPFSWKINGTEWRVGFGDDSASSEIIGTYDMTPTRDYHFDVLKEDCSTAIDDYAVKVVGNTRDGQVPFEGKVEVEIDIDPEKISSSSVFKDSNAPNIKNIRICVKSFLKLGEVSVTFHETILSIFVNMAKNFQIDDIVTDRREAKQENETVDSIATIDKFLCPDGDLTKPDTWNRPSDGTEPSVYKQGSIFRVCVNVTTANVSPESILQFGFNQTNGGTKGEIMMLGLDKEQLFAKGNVATSNCSGSACMIQTMIPPQYFDDLDDNSTPFNLTGSGDILLQFGSGEGTSQRRSRLLQSTNTSTMTRSLQFEGSANSAQFEVPVSLEGAFNGNNIDSFEESAATTATVSHHGAVYAIILIGSVYFALV